MRLSRGLGLVDVPRLIDWRTFLMPPKLCDDIALVNCPLRRSCLLLSYDHDAPRCAGRWRRSRVMSVHRTGRWAWVALLPAVMLMTGAMRRKRPSSSRSTSNLKGRRRRSCWRSTRATTKRKVSMSLWMRRSGALEPIERVASGAYDMGFADINSLIKFRDAKPATPIKAVFMLYNRPPYAVIGRKSRGIMARKIWKAKHLARRRPTAPLRNGRFSCRQTVSMSPR